MKISGKTVVLALWVCLIAALPSRCSKSGQQEYWTFSTCMENPSDKDLKAEVSAELKQYTAQFSDFLISALDKALAGDYSVLKKLRDETTNPPVPFSMKGIKYENLPVKDGAGNLQLRIYSPDEFTATERFPVVIYLHGGGWIFGSVGILS